MRINHRKFSTTASTFSHDNLPSDHSRGHDVPQCLADNLAFSGRVTSINTMK